MNQTIQTETGDFEISLERNVVTIKTADGERAFVGTWEAALQHLAMALEHKRVARQREAEAYELLVEINEYFRHHNPCDPSMPYRYGGTFKQAVEKYLDNALNRVSVRASATPQETTL